MVVSYNCEHGKTMVIHVFFYNGYNYEWLFNNGCNIICYNGDMTPAGGIPTYPSEKYE